MRATRRNALVASTAAAVVALWGLPKSAKASPRMRYNAATPEGKAMLRIYASGVAAMKARSPSDARSWTFQWYIHATPQPKPQLISSVFGSTPSVARSVANETWYTCQSHMNQPEDYFLPWHRLYLLQFEEIIRTVTAHAEFTLPYWDYTTPASYAIPEEFQTKNSHDPVFSSLFVANRNKDGGQLKSADINAGAPLNKYFPGMKNFLVLPDLTDTNYSSFCGQLDNNLHGVVHVYTGDASNMGTIPTAAGDPIFWLHHCNIDRIWAGWNAAGGANPAQTNGTNWADTKFVFADDSGNRTELAISTISDSSALPYAYDLLPKPAAKPLLLAGSSPMDHVMLKSIAGGAEPSAAGATAQPVPLGATAQTVKLAPTAPENKLLAIAPSLRVGGSARLVLLLKDVRAQADPNTTYQVFLDLPPNVSPEAGDEYYVGLLNFFGVMSGTEHAMHAGRTVEFDVTNVVQRLKAGDKLQNQSSVTLVPVGTPNDSAAPLIAGGIELQRR
jgi:tyrosinase